MARVPEGSKTTLGLARAFREPFFFVRICERPPFFKTLPENPQNHDEMIFCEKKLVLWSYNRLSTAII